MTDSAVDLDPALAGDLSSAERLAAEVHVLRARADSLRGPRKGERALLLAVRASQAEQQLLNQLGVGPATRVLAAMADHPATVAAAERWRYAQELAWRIMNPADAPTD